MVKHPPCHSFYKIIRIIVHYILLFKNLLAILFSLPSFPVQSAWVPVLFQSGYTRGCHCSLQMTDRRWLWLCLLLYCLCSFPHGGNGTSCPLDADLRLLPPLLIRVSVREGSNGRSVLEGNSTKGSRLRWRRSWGGAGRGAEYTRWDSDGLLTTRCRLPPSDEPADDSKPPDSSGCPAESSV